MDEWDRKVKRYFRECDSHNAAEEFINERSASLQAFKTNRPLSDEGIHGGRKTIKDIQFVNSWQNKIYGTVHEDGSAAQLKCVSDEAGNYMDVCKKIELLEKYIQQETDEESLLLGQQLRSKWMEEKETQHGKVVATINKLEASA
jgi:hypothetical protein